MEPSEAQDLEGQLNFSFDVEFLLNETFELDNPFKGMNPFDGPSEVATPQEEAIFMPDRDVSFFEGPGILYSLQRGSNTFCLRGMPCLDAKEEWEKIGLNGAGYKKIFRTDDLSEIHFFATPSIECAQVVWEQFRNRRFPYFEDILCNISDPGFSWWFAEGPQGFNVYFKSHGIERSDRFISLGPIGDPRITNRRLKQIKEAFSSKITFKVFSSNETMLKIEATHQSLNFCAWLGALFLDGEFDFTKNVMFGELDLTLQCFLEELAFSRRFWIEIENHLDVENIVLN